MRAGLEVSIVTVIAVVAGCTRPNPDFCCVTTQQCSAAGIDELRPCEIGQACKDTGCVPSECDTSADCTSPDIPICINNLCVAACIVDDDCNGLPDQPFCDVDGACVGCTSNDECTGDKPICDAQTRSCRGCTADDQCVSGVCIEADGTCAADASVIYVTATGQDSGTCTKSAPCRTIQFAQGLLSGARSIIRLLGGQFNLGASTIPLYASVVIDGSNTNLTSAATPAFSLIDVGTLEGVRLSSTGPFASVITISAGGALRLVQATIEAGEVRVNAGGMLNLSDAILRNSNLECMNGNVTVMRSYLDRSIVDSSNCSFGVSASRLEPAPSGAIANIRISGGVITVENNVVVGTDEASTLIFIPAFSVGSSFRFNTIVNTSPVSGSAYALACQDGLDVTSNIIAYNSTNPISCVARNSLFDVPGAIEVAGGVGNVSADVATFFKDRAAGDFHLSTTSPAKGVAEVGLVTTDLDGNARPMPMGSPPDAGAYESP